MDVVTAFFPVYIYDFRPIEVVTNAERQCLV